MSERKKEYIDAIGTLLDKTDDISLLSLIYLLLRKSLQRKESIGQAERA